MHLGMGLRVSSAQQVAALIDGLDATAGTLPPWLSFARSTTGLFIGSNGLLQTASIDTPRFDYTAGAAGLLIEEGRTNLALQSDALSGDTIAGLTNSAAGVTLPSGATGGVKLAETATSGTHATSRNVSISAGQYANFYILKAAERSWVAFEAFVTTLSGAYFDLSNGVVGTRYGSEVSSHGMTSLGNGWWLCWIVGTKPSGFLTYVLSTATGNGASRPNYLGVAGNGVLVAGRQAEAGAFVTSYIPTTTTSVARSADVGTLAVDYRTLPARIDATDLSTGVRSVTTYASGIGATLPANRLIHKVEIYRAGTSL